jgi:hypothetical protein
MKYYLLDIEKTIGHGIPIYWKKNRLAYTADLKEAGLFRKDIAEMMVDSNIDKWIVKVSQQQIEKIFE